MDLTWESLATYAREYWPLLVALAGILAIAILAIIIVPGARRRTQRRELANLRAGKDTIRRPVYVDGQLLEDLRAHPADDGPRVVPSSGQPNRTRMLNETLEALRGTNLLIDLDHDPDASVEAGKAVVLTGHLVRMPGTDAAEMLQLSAPLLERGRTNGDPDPDADGSVRTARPVTGAMTATHAPLVVRLDHPSRANGYLMVLAREHLRVDDPTRLGRPLTVLGVVDEVVGRREHLGLDDYMRPHLTPEGRESLGDRDLSDVFGPLRKAADDGPSDKDLRFTGPGALLTPAAVYR